MNHAHIKQPDFGAGEKTLNVYLVGFISCAILTLLPFAVLMMNTMFQEMAVGIVVACAFAQFIIQLVCFLRLNYHTEQSKVNVKSFAFCMFAVFVLIAGSIWIMVNLDYFMMH